MPTSTGIPQLPPEFMDNNGNPAAGYKLFTYASGTTTKVNTWTDEGQTSLNTNPIVLDAAGRCTIFLDAGSANAYKFVLAPPTDTDPPTSPIWTRDGIRSLAPAPNVIVPTVTVFTASGTWTKATNATWVNFVCVGGGGGAGSGRRGAAGSARFGGGGGGGAAINVRQIQATLLGSTETVTVGAAGSGGAAIAVNDTSGANGTDGGHSAVGVWIRAAGGSKGQGGTAGAGLAGTGGQAGLVVGGDGGNGNDVAGSIGSDGKYFAAAGGGGGGGINAADASAVGAAGGTGSFGRTTTLAGGAGGSPATVGSSATANEAAGGGGGGGGNAGGAGAGVAGAAGGRRRSLPQWPGLWSRRSRSHRARRIDSDVAILVSSRFMLTHSPA